MDIHELTLTMVRENPLEFYNSGDMWLFNFAMLNFNMQTFGVKLNPNIGDDETVTDWLTTHNELVSIWFFEHYKDKDYFLPIDI